MNRGRFFENPDFVEYVRLLGRLHRLMREERDESEEGEALRDEMDRPGEALSADEVRSVKAISADLYMINDHQGAVPSQPDAPPRAVQDAFEAIARHDVLLALAILRKHANEIPALTLAQLRGDAFKAVGLSEIAADFFDYAKRLAPVSDRSPARSRFND